jgi:hypothetical protein
VLFGTTRGLSASGMQSIRTTDVPGLALGSSWAGALAVGDLDDDGYGDLVAVGDGSLVALRGSSAGLVPWGVTPFGWSVDLAVGDFDGDGDDDVAASQASDSTPPQVFVYASSSAGIGDEPTAAFDETTPGLAGRGGGLGVLAAGDFNGDDVGDLAIGAETANGGGVHVLFGGPDGPSAVGSQFWTQDTPGVPGVGESVDGFGTAMVAADLDGNGADDLAIGVPLEKIGDQKRVGQVIVLRGTAGVGLTTSGATRWTQDSAGVPDRAQQNDYFGATLAAGNYGSSFREDLAIGVPGEDYDRKLHMGMVNVLYGTRSGLSGARAQRWWQDAPGIKGVGEYNDHFGEVLAR